jgi:hypothetical protein
MGVVNTTYTFLGTDTITSSKLNNIIDETTFTGDAIQGTTLQIVSPGKLAVSAGGITSNELASNSVVTAKILDSNVTTAKIADSNVTTAKIADANVTPTKLSEPFTSGTAVTASGSSIDFTSIPSWVKKITIIINEISTTVNSPVLIRIGTSSGIETTGYSTTISNIASTAGTASYTIGFYASTTLVSSRNLTGIASICLVGSNTWISSYVGNDGSNSIISSGSKILSSTLDRISLVATAGSFDAGSVNIIYQ